MMTATIARKKTLDRHTDMCRLTIHIRGTAYAVTTMIAPALGAGRRSWRLRNATSGLMYDVADTVHGPTCDCGDQTFRHEGIDGSGCKHIRACRALGLLSGR